MQGSQPVRIHLPLPHCLQEVLATVLHAPTVVKLIRLTRGVVILPEDRKCVLQRTGRCFVCLRRGHVSRACTSSIRCPKCGGRHHVSICSKIQDARSQRDESQKTRATKTDPTLTTSNKGNHSLMGRPGLNPDAPVYRTPVNHTSLWVNSG